MLNFFHAEFIVSAEGEAVQAHDLAQGVSLRLHSCDPEGIEALRAKVAKLEKQVADAEAETKAKIEKRMAEVKAGHKARVAKLKEANSLIKEALTV